MKISVFGLGYVGAVTSACFARDGFRVVGVDVQQEKVDMVAAGRSPIIELGLSELLREGIDSGRLTATTDSTTAVAETDVSLICVGTPSREGGELDLTYVYRVCEEIGAAIAAKGGPHVVVIRSTVLPGTTQRCREILRAHAGGQTVSIAFNPEFLREGAAIRDYDSPPYTVIGADDEVAENTVRELYAGVDAPVVVVRLEEAELVKACANAWHTTKIVFANEIGRLAKACGVDGRAVMDLLKQDTKLNISPAYLSPGFAFGGSCLPKDVRALGAVGREREVALPLLGALVPSNEAHLEAAHRVIVARGPVRVSWCGLAFKSGTDDLRESPSLALVRRLLDEGCDVRIYDEAVREATLIGANRSVVERSIPRLPELLVADVEDLVAHAEVLVVAHASPRLRSLVERVADDVPIVDLAGLFQIPPEGKTYHGLGW